MDKDLFEPGEESLSKLRVSSGEREEERPKYLPLRPFVRRLYET